MANTGVSGVSSDRKLAIDRRLDGEFAKDAMPDNSEFNWFGGLIKNTKLVEAMKVDADDVAEVIAGQTEHMAIAIELLASSYKNDDPETKDLKDIYGREVSRLAQDLYDAEKIVAKQKNVERLLLRARKTNRGKSIKRLDSTGFEWMGIVPESIAGKDPLGKPSSAPAS